MNSELSSQPKSITPEDIKRFEIPSGMMSDIFSAKKNDLYTVLKKNQSKLRNNIFAIHISSIDDIWDTYFWAADVFSFLEKNVTGSVRGYCYLDIDEALVLEGLHLHQGVYGKPSIPSIIFIDSFLDSNSETKQYKKLCSLLNKYILNSNNLNCRRIAFTTTLEKDELLEKIKTLPTTFSVVLKDLLLYIDKEGIHERV